jgi:hypothetical protein
LNLKSDDPEGVYRGNQIQYDCVKGTVAVEQ